MSDKKNFHELSSDELRKELDGLQKERFNLQMQKTTGQEVKSHLFRVIRRNIARIKTILASKEA